MDIDKAIVLLKQYGTPVWKSAVAGVKFKAIASMSVSLIGLILLIICFRYVWNSIDEHEGESTDSSWSRAELRVIMLIVFGGLAILAGIWFFDGAYSLVALNHEAYKLMLLQ